MRNAYALLGLAFLIVFGTAYFLMKETAEAPTEIDTSAEATDTNMSLNLTSSAFSDGGVIPSQFTCDGDNVSPPLSVSGVPEGTESLVLVMDDPDIPEQIKASRGITKFNHWVVYNLPSDIIDIPAGYTDGSVGLNSAAAASYTGPCPPADMEPLTHRYIFRIYALSGQLNFIKEPTLDEVEVAAKGSALAHAELTGVYSRAQE